MTVNSTCAHSTGPISSRLGCKVLTLLFSVTDWDENRSYPLLSPYLRRTLYGFSEKNIKFESDSEADMSFTEISAAVNKIAVTHIGRIFRHSDILYT